MCIEENIGNPYQLKIKHKGGMSNNYDFLVKNESHKKMKLEFKYKSTGNIKNFLIIIVMNIFFIIIMFLKCVIF